MFTLELYDSKGIKLNIGDIVRVSNGRIEFFAEVKYLMDEQIITPFHTFSFHTFQKVDSLPEGLNKSGETRYNIWYNPLTNHENEDVKDSQYLMDWRQCEHLLEKRCYRIQIK
jgi:hypothetical protein